MTLPLPRLAGLPLVGDAAIASIRADRERLPRLLRRLHRIQTGIADRGETPRSSTPLREFARDAGLLAGFAALAGASAVVAAGGGLAALPAAPLAVLGSLGVAGRLRRFVVGHVHEAGHRTATRFYRARRRSPEAAKAITRFILDAGSAFTLTLEGDAYRKAHDAHHDERHLGTERDPDGAELKSWGFWAGLPRDAFFPHLLATLASPRWHLASVGRRLRSNLLDGRPARRLVGAGVLAGLAGLGFVLPLPAYLAAVALPWTVLYQAAALLQVLTKHPYGACEPAEDLAAYAARTWERVPIDPLPAADLAGSTKARAWARWLVRLAFLHVPTRLAVLDSTMVAHSFHHTAWPSGLAFDDWWLTAERMVEARERGALPRAAQAPVLFGLDAVLRRQADHMAARRCRGCGLCGAPAAAPPVEG